MAQTGQHEHGFVQTSMSPSRKPLPSRESWNTRKDSWPLGQQGRISPKNSGLSAFDQFEVRLQETPASPVNISPPQRVAEPETASIKGMPLTGVQEEGAAARRLPTPDSMSLGDSVVSLPLRSRANKVIEDGRQHVRASSAEPPRIQESGPEEDARNHEQEQQHQEFRYHAFDDAPKKKMQNRISHNNAPSIGSSSSGGDNSRSSQQLNVPRTRLQRPASAYTLGSELRGRTLSPFSGGGSEPGSPGSYARDRSTSGRSPSSRPMSYVDLLNNVPYNQQVAPGPALHNPSLQSAVGSAASLLDTRKTLEMYRANVKKTTDAAVQYEFAIFMINAARDAQPGDGLDQAQLISEGKHILQRLSDRTYPFAQYYLGDGYFSGLFNKDKPDYDKAFPLFVSASKHGHAEAGYRTALCYEFGWGTAKSYPKAVQFYRTASSKNHPGAASRLGLACIRGDMGLAKSYYREGIKWLKRAQESADFQYNAAPFELGLLHLTGYGDDIFKDEGYAAQLFTQSAELGHVQANFMMGQAYENGLYGCPRDAALSVHFYTGAASHGHADAMMALCAWYMIGAEPVLEKDEGEAYAWAKQAADLGLPKAEYAIGYFTEMGIGCRRDPLEANVWYVNAAEKGNETAKQRLAIIRAAASGADGDPGVPMAKVEPRSKELASNGAEKKKGKFMDALHLGHHEPVHRLQQLARDRHLIAAAVAARRHGADRWLRSRARCHAQVREPPGALTRECPE
nr:protein skt5 [Quercus suber]